MLAISGLSASGQTLTWSGTGAVPPVGGPGIWDTTSLRWYDGTNIVAWPGGSNNAYFGNAAGNVVVNTAISAGGLYFNGNYKVINPGTAVTAVTLTTGIIDVAGNSDVQMINTISGSNGLTKQGTGTFRFEGGNNYTGATNINAGTFAYDNTSTANIPDLSITTVASGAALDFGINGGAYNDTIGLLAGAGNVLLKNYDNFGVTTGSLVTFGSATAATSAVINNSTTFSGTISGIGGRVTKNGINSSITLSGTNTYTGVTSINQGTVTLQGGSAIADTATVFVGNAGTYTATATFTTALVVNSDETIGGLGGTQLATTATQTFGASVILNNATLTIGGDNRSQLFSAPVTGTGRIIKVGTGVQAFGNFNSTWTGGLTIKNGIFSPSTDTRLGAVPASPDATNVILDGGTFASQQNTGLSLNVNRGFTVTANNGFVLASAATTGTSTTIAGTVTGAGKITKVGGGNLTLSNTVNHTGGTDILDGSVTSAQTTGNPLGTGSVKLDSATLSVLPAAGALAINVNYATAAGATLAYGPGSQLTVGPNTNASVVANFGPSGAATSSLVRNTGGHLIINPTAGVVSSLGQTSGQFTQILVNGGVPTGVNGGVAATNGEIVSPSIISTSSTADTSGEFLTYGANGFARGTYSAATDLNASTANDVFNATASQAITSTATAYALNARASTITGGTLNVGSGTGQPATIISNGATLSNSDIDFGAREGIIYAGSTSASTVNATLRGTGGFTKLGAGSLVLNTSAAYSGTTTLAGGTLTVGTSNVLPTATNLKLLNAGRLNINGNALTVGTVSGLTQQSVIDLGTNGTLTVGAGNSTYLGSITSNATTTVPGTSTLVKDGAGVLSLGYALSNSVTTSSTNTFAKLVVKNGGVVEYSALASLGVSPLATTATPTPGPGLVSDRVTLDNGTLRDNTFAAGSLVNGGASANSLLSAFSGLTLGAGGGTIEVSNPLEIAIYQAGNDELVASSRALISGSGDLIKTGPGFLRLGIGNTYTGRTIIRGGNLQFQTDASAVGNNTGALGATPASLVANQLELDSGAIQSNGTGTISANRGVFIGAGGGTFNGGVYIKSPVTGAGAVNKISASQLTFENPNNTFSGGLTVFNGRAEFSATGSSGTGPIVFQPYFPVILSHATGTADTTIPNNIVLNNGSTIDILVNTGVGDLFLSGTVSGPNTFYKSGGASTGQGTLRLTGTNTFTGDAVVQTGFLVAQSNGALGSAAGATIVNPGAGLGLVGGITIASEPVYLGSTGPSSLGGIFNASGNNTLGGPITLTADSSINVAADSLTTGLINGPKSSLTKTGVSPLTTAGLRVQGLNVSAGTVSVSAGRTAAKTSQIGTISLASGPLDLNDNDAVFTATTAVDIRAALISGGASGAYTGSTGITSSTAATAAATSTKTALGYGTASSLGLSSVNGLAVSPTDVIVRYTVAGDINLDLTVDTVDFAKLIAGFGPGSAAYTAGDLNYDSNTDSVDFNVLIANYGKSAAPALGGLPGGPGALVPEPTSLAAIGLIAGGLMARRRRA